MPLQRWSSTRKTSRPMVEAITFTSEEERSAYRMMLLIRRFEEKAGQLYALGMIAGSSPLSIGQEALITGLAMAARSGDRFVAAHRTHGLMLALGVSPEAILAETHGPQNRSRRRPWRIASHAGARARLFRRLHHSGPGCRHCIWPRVLRPRSRAGETSPWLSSAMAQPAAAASLEAYAHASRMALPVVFVIDNNAASADENSPPQMTSRLQMPGGSTNIPGVQVDGIDVRKVRAQAQIAIERARSGDGPTILEMMTYRYRGHGGMPSPPGPGRKAPRRCRPRQQSPRPHDRDGGCE